MENNLLLFEAIEWDKTKVGIEQKVFQRGDKKLRLLIFKDDFVENDWCVNGHVGYVLEGEMKIDFNGNTCNYKKGDGLWIDKGEKFKHKVIIEKGKFIKLILFE